MIAKRLVSAMNASSSDMASADDGLYKVKQKIKSNQNQRKIKRAMEEKEKSNAAKFPSDKTDKIPSNVTSNRSSNKSSNTLPELEKYSRPIKYKFSQFKKEVKGKVQDVTAEMKKKSMIRKQNRAAAGEEGGFSVCGPGGCKEGNYSEGRDKPASKPAWMGKN